VLAADDFLCAIPNEGKVPPNAVNADDFRRWANIAEEMLAALQATKNGINFLFLMKGNHFKRKWRLQNDCVVGAFIPSTYLTPNFFLPLSIQPFAIFSPKFGVWPPSLCNLLRSFLPSSLSPMGQNCVGGQSFSQKLLAKECPPPRRRGVPVHYR
jgi:hypothetical protein